ncbi:MAG: hypothetical protein KAJ46_05325, partial [Sedimentisphaerales bacterium]|nr:hypothetical protein [Sedimentisphaerales bacterium]
MAYDFSVFNENDHNERQKLDEEFVVWLVNEKALDVNLHFEKLWSYYRNEMREISTTAAGTGQVSETARPYRQSQEY